MIRQKVPNENLCRHMIAVGAIMKRLAAKMQADPVLWEITGILHDIDLGVTDDPAQHGRIGAEWLKEKAMPDDMIQAILAHAGHTECKTGLDTLLLAADQLSGLITACALIMGKKLSNVAPKSVQKRFKEARFAAGADRNAIRMCEHAGIPLDVFIEEGLEAMKSVSGELGL